MIRTLTIILFSFLTLQASFVKLKNNSTWNMTHDKQYIYTLTNNSKKDTYYIEIYDKNLKFIKSKKLNIPKQFVDLYGKAFVKIYNKPFSISVSNKYIYISTKKDIIFYDKYSLKKVSSYKTTKPTCHYNYEYKEYICKTNDIIHFSKYKNYIFAYGYGDDVYIFKDDKVINRINVRRHYPKNITKIHDYFDGSRNRIVYVHNNKIYIGNWRGFINIYDLKTFRFLKQISTIGFNKEYGYITADTFINMKAYKNRWLYISMGLDGVMIYDTKTKTYKKVKTFFPLKEYYSELFKKYYKSAKFTEIYAMDIYKDYLFFNDEINHKNSVYIYDIKNKKIIHQYKNLNGKISSMFIEDHYVFALCSDGYIYKWNINKVLEK